jgi:hypothetical protein
MRMAWLGGAILALAMVLMMRPAFAQSDDPSLTDPAVPDHATDAFDDAGDAARAAPSDDFATPPPSEPPVASAPSFAGDPPAASDDGSASAADATASDSSSGSPSEVDPSAATPSSDPSASSGANGAAHSGWIRMDDRSVSDGSDSPDSVLELPQVVDKNSADGDAPNNSDAAPNDPAAAPGDAAPGDAAPGDAAQTANAGDDGDAETDADADSSDAIDQYEAQVNASGGPIYVEPALIQPQIIVPYGYRLAPRYANPGWMNRVPMAGGYNFRPRINSMNGAFTPTNPMLMRSGGPSMPGGWMMRAR